MKLFSGVFPLIAKKPSCRNVVVEVQQTAYKTLCFGCSTCGMHGGKCNQNGQLNDWPLDMIFWKKKETESSTTGAKMSSFFISHNYLKVEDISFRPDAF